MPIDTPRYTGRSASRAERLDDLALKTYRETIDPNSPMVIMLSPSGTPIRQANAHDMLENEGPYYADFGWAPQPGSKIAFPPPTPSGRRSRRGPLTPASPAVLEWDNGEGLLFRRTISVDKDQMFTVVDAVENAGRRPCSYRPSRSSRAMARPTWPATTSSTKA